MTGGSCCTLQGQNFNIFAEVASGLSMITILAFQQQFLEQKNLFYD
jgi:hypothetical protein